MLDPESPRFNRVNGGGDARSGMLARTRPPVAPPDLLRRGRLSAQLTAGVTDRFTLVSAGPGWGKTLAVASWVASEFDRGPVAWLSLDESDNDPRTFFSDLIGALIAGGGVRAGGPLLDRERTGRFDAVDVHQLWVLLADLPDPVVVVIDDFQVITDGAVLDVFGRLIVQFPPLPLRLVVLGRADPVLPLHHLRVGGHFTEIRASDLAFTPGEIEELFTLSNVDLRGDQVDRLRDRTGGWPAGLRAAALSIDHNAVDAGIDRYHTDELGVVDFFLGEVMRAIPAADLDFMLKTSIPDLRTGDVADHLTGRSDGQLVLQRLARRNISPSNTVSQAGSATSRCCVNCSATYRPCSNPVPHPIYRFPSPHGRPHRMTHECSPRTLHHWLRCCHRLMSG
jgi:LuxR family maltose regulon positive regulatory protein